MKKIQAAVLMILATSVIAVSISFAGCSKSQQTNASVSGASSGQGQSFSIDSYKQQLDNSLATLVQNGTITNDQETKIIDAYANMFSSRMANRSMPSGSMPSGSKPSGSMPSGSKPSGSMPSGSRPSGSENFSPLSSLVKNKTITQAQADAVEQAVSQNIGFGQGRGGNGTASQDGQNQTQQ